MLLYTYSLINTANNIKALKLQYLIQLYLCYNKRTFLCNANASHYITLNTNLHWIWINANTLCCAWKTVIIYVSSIFKYRISLQDRFYLSAVDKRWHVNCLQCHACRQPLDRESSCYSRDGNIYCKNDYYRWVY